MKEYILAIDTSSKVGLCALAVIDGPKLSIIHEEHINAELSHSEQLFIGIAK